MNLSGRKKKHGKYFIKEFLHVEKPKTKKVFLTFKKFDSVKKCLVKNTKRSDQANKRHCSEQF